MKNSLITFLWAITLVLSIFNCASNWTNNQAFWGWFVAACGAAAVLIQTYKLMKYE